VRIELTDFTSSYNELLKSLKLSRLHCQMPSPSFGIINIDAELEWRKFRVPLYYVFLFPSLSTWQHGSREQLRAALVA